METSRLCLYSAQEDSTPALLLLLLVSAFGRTIPMVCIYTTATTWLFLNLPSISSDATPGYFSLTLNNSIQMEATATRRAGLERFTFPANSQPYFVLDLANDLPASFNGGELTIDPTQGRIMIGGEWGSRY
jgi:hypothetical protein